MTITRVVNVNDMANELIKHGENQVNARDYVVPNTSGMSSGESYAHSSVINMNTTAVKQQRYQDDDGEDLIDEWARTLSHEHFRVVMYAMVQKYQRRLGKKAPIPEETAKMADYMNRWHEYELIWAGEAA